jgi:hypothetical protein
MVIGKAFVDTAGRSGGAAKRLAKARRRRYK